MCVTMNTGNNFSTSNTTTVNRNQPPSTDNNVSPTNNPANNDPNRTPIPPANPNGIKRSQSVSDNA